MKRCIVWLASLLLAINAFASESQDAVSATESLLGRLLPKHTGQFVFELVAAENGLDVFEIESRDAKTVIRGNNGVAMATRSVSAVTAAPVLDRALWTTPRDQVRLAGVWRDLLQAADELGKTDTAAARRLRSALPVNEKQKPN